MGNVLGEKFFILRNCRNWNKFWSLRQKCSSVLPDLESNWAIYHRAVASQLRGQPQMMYQEDSFKPCLGYFMLWLLHAIVTSCCCYFIMWLLHAIVTLCYWWKTACRWETVLQLTEMRGNDHNRFDFFVVYASHFPSRKDEVILITVQWKIDLKDTFNPT